jgi:hypothetical protein
MYITLHLPIQLEYLFSYRGGPGELSPKVSKPCVSYWILSWQFNNWTFNAKVEFDKLEIFQKLFHKEVFKESSCRRRLVADKSTKTNDSHPDV